MPRYQRLAERGDTLNDEAWQQVAVPAGYVLAYDGDWRDQVFVVSDGTAAVVVDGRAERLLGPGTVLGAEPPLAPPAPGTMVMAATPARFLVCDRRTFAALATPRPAPSGDSSTRPPGRRPADRLTDPRAAASTGVGLRRG
jgi:CRP-like cAMP-binding protein